MNCIVLSTVIINDCCTKMDIFDGDRTLQKLYPFCLLGYWQQLVKALFEKNSDLRNIHVIKKCAQTHTSIK